VLLRVRRVFSLPYAAVLRRDPSGPWNVVGASGIAGDDVTRVRVDVSDTRALQVAGRSLSTDDRRVLAAFEPPAFLVGSPLGESGVRRRHGITVVGGKRPGEPFNHATSDTVLRDGDMIIVSRVPQSVERFSELC